MKHNQWRREEIIWAAGLFDGEGCITSYRKWKSVFLSLSMTDEDSVIRFHRFVGGLGGIYEKLPPANKPTYKKQWVWQTKRWEEAQALLIAFYPWLNKRRQDRAIEILTARRQIDSVGRTPKKGLTCSLDGCNVKRYARGLCLKHYSSARRKQELGAFLNRQGVVSKSSPSICREPGCGLFVERRGMCEKHYSKFANSDVASEPDVSRGPSQPIRRCTEAGCNRPHKAHGLCNKHWQAKRYRLKKEMII